MVRAEEFVIEFQLGQYLEASVCTPDLLVHMCVCSVK